MLKANRKSRRVLLAGATGILGMTVAGLGLTASGAAAEQIRSVAAVQVPALAAQVAPVAPPAAVEPPPPAPVAPVRGERRHTKVVVVRDGKTETYEGPAADAYILAHPGVARHTGQRSTHRIVIRGKDGKVATYEGAEAEAYLKAHPEMKPPLPPVPPVAGVAPPPPPPGMSLWTSPDGKTTLRSFSRRGPGGQTFAFGHGPTVIHADCGDKDKGQFVRSEKTKDGKARLVICTGRAERFALDHARLGKLHALAGLDAGRAAIIESKDLSDAQRSQALAGIDQARAALQAEAKDGKGDK